MAQKDDNGSTKVFAAAVGGYYLFCFAILVICTYIVAHFVWKYW